jgi:hypothetical protein
VDPNTSAAWFFSLKSRVEGSNSPAAAAAAAQHDRRYVARVYTE